MSCVICFEENPRVFSDTCGCYNKQHVCASCHNQIDKCPFCYTSFDYTSKYLSISDLVNLLEKTKIRGCALKIKRQNHNVDNVMIYKTPTSGTSLLSTDKHRCTEHLDTRIEQAELIQIDYSEWDYAFNCGIRKSFTNISSGGN